MQTLLGTVVFFAVILGAWGGIHIYLYRRITGTYDLGRRDRRVLMISLAVLASLYFLGRVIQARIDHDIGTFIIWPGAVYLAVLSIGLTFLLAFEIGAALPFRIMIWTGVLSKVTRNPIVAIRRRLLPIVGIVSVVLCAFGTVGALQGPSVTKIELGLAGLPSRLDGFRLVHLSDLHVGGLVGRGYLEKVLDRVEPLDADLIVITGDLSDERHGGNGDVLRMIAGIPSSYGVLSVTGNHEFYIGGESAIATYERYGLPVLRQEHRVVAGGLVVAGVDDPSFLGGPTLVDDAILDALENVQEGLPVVLLSHQPLGVEQAAVAGVDLMLCGHTHGGQVPPFHFLSKVIYGYLSGLYEVGDMRLYVSNGAGFWGPATRLFADPEIVLITIRRTRAPGYSSHNGS